MHINSKIWTLQLRSLEFWCYKRQLLHATTGGNQNRRTWLQLRDTILVFARMACSAAS